MICAPILPVHITLGHALTTMALLKRAPEGCRRVLWVRDWTSIALNALDGTPKGIRAGYTVLTAALHGLDPNFMANVDVVWQSEAILKDPSNYWISAINAGRAFQLGEILDPARSDTPAGVVVQALMHVADVLALSPVCAVCLPEDEHLFRLADDHRAQLAASELPEVSVVTAPSVSTQLREAPVPGTLDIDGNIFVLDEPTQDCKRKMKRAFCEPQNVAHNPPLCIGWELARHRGGTCRYAADLAGSPADRGRRSSSTRAGVLRISRKAENGGDVEYVDFGRLEEDFKSGALHPGDLKPAVSAVIADVLKSMQHAIASAPEGKRAEADLKQCIKQAAKAKK